MSLSCSRGKHMQPSHLIQLHIFPGVMYTGKNIESIPRVVEFELITYFIQLSQL